MKQALSILGLQKTYPNGFEALKGIDLVVEQGDFFGLLGPNGAGKSTTLNIITSLVRKSAGQVQVFEHDIDVDFCSAKKYLGVVPQEFNFNQFDKVFDVVATQAGFYGIPRALAVERTEKYLKKLGLWEKREDSSRMLSGGMKRRLMIARALVHEPKILILDEPTAGVDIELRRSMWDFLREINASGTTIILTTHYLEEAESLCRNIAIIDQGRIVKASSTRDLLRQLNTETFVFDVAEALDSAPQIAGFDIALIDPHCLEIRVDRGQHINQLFETLTAQGVHITSMRNKTNRLEELFVSLVGKNTPVDKIGKTINATVAGQSL
jgi:ABC-2 type transport system ATP-binding protein